MWLAEWQVSAEVKEHFEKLDGIVLVAERVHNQKAGFNENSLEWLHREDIYDEKEKDDTNTEDKGKDRKNTQDNKEQDIEKWHFRD